VAELGDLIPTAFDANQASFVETLRRTAPDALPPVLRGELPAELRDQLVHGTTVISLLFAGGVIVAGDRRATTGNIIARGDMRKVFPADQWSAIAIAGAAGPAMELARVFAIELEHYEKVEGDPLSLEGKGNKLAGMVRANMGLAMQGLVVVPLFAGVEAGTNIGSIFEYDPIGGQYRAADHAASGSRSMIAKQTLKRFVDPEADEATATSLAIEALFDAAEDDSATGGPDLVRRIYPIVAVLDEGGYRELDEERVAELVQAVVDDRETRRARRD
jgi:proteasome beta subunit